MTAYADLKKNFIFDLYGTLLDIWTDETNPSLWEWLATKYCQAGSDYTAEEISSVYHRLVKEKEAELGKRLNTQWPEIELREVFRDTLRCDKSDHSPDDPHNTSSASDPVLASESSPARQANTEKWIGETAVSFRVRSRLRFRLFEDTLPVLRELKKRGKKVYLLSNAQACFTKYEIGETGIGEYFDKILISSDRHVKKPEKRFMGMLLEEEHLNIPDSVMIGNDYSSDVASAAQWGMDAIFLNTDGYSAEDRAGRLAQMRQQFHVPDYKPAVIASGRLMEIFSPVQDPEKV